MRALNQSRNDLPLRPIYRARRTHRNPLSLDWHDAAWAPAHVLRVADFHPNSSVHRPLVQARMLHDDAAIYVAFLVDDQFVRCVHTVYQSNVYLDSCVELYVQPQPHRGYFNFEVNCGGAMLLHYNDGSTRTPLPATIGQTVAIATTLPRVVEPPIVERVSWQVRMRIPLTIFESQVGALGGLSGQRWHANFHKCGDESPRPHWASWAPIGARLSFDQPDRFGEIRFE